MAQGVAGFNAGSSAMTLSVKEQGLEISDMLLILAEKRDIKRIRAARLKASATRKAAREKKQAALKLERASQLLKEGPSYGPGIDQ